jgi:CheY-like chemotaxis protein
MEAVTCLYYEDNPDEQDRYKRWIEMAWGKLEFACPLNIETIASYNEAREEIDKNSSKYQLLIADLLEADKDKNKYRKLGLHLIKQVRELNPTIAIVALTIGGEPGTDLRTEAIDSGADGYIRKDELDERKLGYSELSEIIRAALIKHGHEPISVKSIKDKYDPDDYSLLAVIETIGIDTLKILALKLLEAPITQIALHHISPGYSGAHVLRLDCKIEGDLGAVPKPRSILLKVSHDKYILQAEVGNKKQLYYFPSQLCAKLIKDELVAAIYEGDHPTKKKKWYAIGYDFLKGAKTLIDWIIEDDLESEQIHATLRSLFLSSNGLKKIVYDETVEDDNKRPNISLNSLITSWRKVSILKAIEDFSPLAQNFDVANEYDSAKVITFLKHKRIFECDENSFPIGTKLCRVHGDFHGRNILVNDTGIPYIIDPANICEAHWATDIARLVVDLIVSGLDNGPKSHLWDTCQEWFTKSADIIQLKLKHEETKTANDRILSTVSFLLNELPNIYEKCWNGHEWEFQLALAIEFLRSSYRDDISVPKRVLGLVAGCYALKTISDNQRV